MEMLVNNNYVLSSPDKNQLKDLGFRYNKQMSDSDGVFYSMKFPVLEHNDQHTVYGEIAIDMNSGNIRVNAYCVTGRSYPPFYQEYTKIYEPVMKKINRNFKRMLNKIGAKEEE